MSGRPEPCQGCGRRPRAHGRSLYCYDCMPGGPHTPPPCRRCGTSGDYYASGLCTECHLHAPKIRIGSCRHCHAWGAKRHNRWVCKACINWNGKYPTGTCAACDTPAHVDGHGVCRLCLVTARRQRINQRPIDFPRAGLAQQLFLADMHKAATVATRPAPPTLSPRWPPGRPVTHRQLVAFKMPHDLSRGRGVVPAPRDPELAAALIARVEDYAERVGWHWQHTRVVRASIRVLLGLQDTPGAPITTTEATVLSQLRLPVRSALEVLAEVGMVEDDRTPRIVDWFNRETSGLPAPMTREIHAWFQILHEGHATPPRAKPRSPTTIKLYTRAITPALHTWARDGHESLREITRADILAALPAPGPDRDLCGRGLRSLFRTLKTHKLVFTNPAQRLGTRHDGPIVLPTDDLDPIRDALNSDDPARAALAALVAFHGLRTGDLRHLKITDIADRRITVDNRVIPLAPAVQQRVRALIDHRNQRWPTTINPHLFIHFRTARRTDPVGNRWIKLTLDLPGGVRALRRDRILDEAAATAGDTRRVSDLFGLSVQQASRYTDPITAAPSLPGPD